MFAVPRLYCLLPDDERYSKVCTNLIPIVCPLSGIFCIVQA